MQQHPLVALGQLQQLARLGGGQTLHVPQDQHGPLGGGKGGDGPLHLRVAALEPHAAVARFTGDMLEVHLSTQAVAELAKLIAKRFSLPEDKVRVIAEHVGGGFGAKAGVHAETVAAVTLAKAAGAPVRVVIPARRL